jgi:hypothetical protein
MPQEQEWDGLCHIARKLDEAFRRGGTEGVRSLRFGAEPRATDWIRGDRWALSTESAQ